MAFYRRPFFIGSDGVRRSFGRITYPYSARLFTDCDVFEIFPLDGGAFFFTNQHIGDKTTRRFVETYETGRLFAPCTGARRVRAAARDLDWFAAYDPERGPWTPGQRVEQHVWLHRLYFLLPFAQQYMRTGHAVWAKRWFEFFREWRTRFPAMGDPATMKPKDCAFIWYDMQPAWRLITLLHSVFLLSCRRRKSPLSRANWREIYRAIRAHARWVHAEVDAGLRNGATGNHFLQKGAALICAGVLYPEFDSTAEWVNAGCLVLGDQMRREIRPDGGSVEGAPSYSHFIAGLYLAAYLMLKSNRRRPIRGLDEVIRRQYSFLADTMTPSGRTLQMGDSYSLDVRRNLEIAGRLFPLSRTAPSGSHCFTDSRLVVLRSRDVAVYVDAGDVDCWHSHPPKPNFVVYYGTRQVVMECGCVNYDLPAHKTGHFRTWAAHNVVAPDAFLGVPQAGRGIRLKLLDFEPEVDGGSVALLCRYRGADTSFTWRRTVCLAGDRVEIADRVTAPRRQGFTLFVHLCPDGRGRAKPEIKITDGIGRMLRRAVASFRAVNARNRICGTRTIRCRQTGNKATFVTVLSFSGADTAMT